MHKILVVLVSLLCSLSVSADELHLAVIQFPEVKTAAALDAVLAGVNLAEISNSNRTITRESYLKGGYVVFAQSVPVDSRFASATRLSNARADVLGGLDGGSLNVTITLSEGVDAGLRRFSSRVYKASAPLSPGQPRVLSLRQISGKTQTAIKGQAAVKETSFCCAILGQITK